MRLIRARLERLEAHSTANEAHAELADVFGVSVGTLAGIPAAQARNYLEALREFGRDWTPEEKRA